MKIDLSLLTAGLIILGAILGFATPLIGKRNNNPLFFLSPKRTNSDISLNDVVANLTICNKYDKEDFKNGKYKQEKL